MRTVWEYCEISGQDGQVLLFSDEGEQRPTIVQGALIAVANQLGREGWEAFAFRADEDSSTYVFKRPKQSP